MGLYPHNTGIHNFNTAYTGALNWTHRLRQGGYTCVSVGKTHIKGSNHGYHVRIHDQGNKYAPTYHVGDGRQVPCDWVKELESAGFSFAELHTMNERDPHFYDKLAAIEWPLPEEFHPDTWMGNKAVSFIRDKLDEDGVVAIADALRMRSHQARIRVGGVLR